MVSNRGEQLLRHGMQGIGVVKHVQPLGPGFLAILVHLVSEHFRERCIGVMIMVGAHAKQPDVAFTESCLLAHSVEFGDGTAGGEHDRTDVFGIWLEEEARRNLLAAQDVFINFLRCDNQLSRLVVVMLVAHAVEIVYQGSGRPQHGLVLMKIRNSNDQRLAGDVIELPVLLL
ncbi:hypothetical protein D3C71_1263530 [compost metagenome]